LKTKVKSKKTHIVTLLFPYLQKYRFKYLAGFLCLVTVDAAQMLIPQYVRRAIDIIASGGFHIRQIIFVAALMTGTMLIIASGRFLWRYFIHGSSRRIEASLRQALFSRLLTLSGDFYQQNKIGDLMARINSDTGAVRMAVGWGLVGLVDGTIMAASILIIIFIQNGSTAALAIIPFPAITVLIILFGKMIGPRFLKAQAAYSSMSDAVQETFAGSRVIKSFVKEKYFIHKFALTNDEYKKANMELVKVHGFFFPLVTFLSGITTLIVIFAGGRRVILGIMSPGDFVALFSYIQMLIWPVFGAGFTVNMIQRGIVSLNRIHEILSAVPSIKNEVSAPPDNLPDETFPAVEIRNLSFTYTDYIHTPEGAPSADVPSQPSAALVLRNISFSLPHGKWIGILGRTGSGKSTLIKILPRLLDPPRGTVFVYGIDIHDIPLESLRALFGVSPQDSFLFSDSIKNNIAYGVEQGAGGAEGAAADVRGAGEAAAGDAGGVLIRRMIDIAALHGDLAEFAAGEDTQIGERGLTLSGGQKQRVSIARAAITRAPILILDDSLSAVDADTERRILKALDEERRGKTTVIVSHRISAFRNADFAAVLENGALTEFGTPAALLSANGYYAKTARLQRLSE
jgi:ATP-binding cassette subfamily B protein